MNKLLITTLLSTMAFSANSTDLYNLNEIVDFSGKVFESNLQDETIKLTFIDEKNIILKTKCYSVTGKYTVYNELNSKYHLDFSLQNYTDVVANCEQSSFSKQMAVLALRTADWNSEFEISVNPQFQTQVIMYSTSGDIFSYNRII